MTPVSRRRAALLAAACVCAVAARQPESPSPKAPDHVKIRSAMAGAATELLNALDGEGRTLASTGFDDPERRTWAFGPVTREGVDLGQLSAEQFRQLETLLDTALSESGLQAWHQIRHLESVLFERESRAGRPATHRDPDLYWLRVYGEPGVRTRWSWRFEGHHLALHVTCAPGAMPTVTPFFLGASPLLDVGVRELSVDAFGTLSRAAGKMLDTVGDAGDRLSPGQRPGDVRMAPGQDKLPPLNGLALEGAPAPQQAAAAGLLDAYLALLDEPLRQHALEASGKGAVFAHWGGRTLRDERAWSLVTETFALELTTTTGPEHVHVLLRGTSSDFGGAKRQGGDGR